MLIIKQVSPLDAIPSKSIRLRCNSAFGIAMSLTFDLWPGKPFQQCPLLCWKFVQSFTEIPVLSEEILRYAEYDNDRTNGRTDGRPENISLSPPIVSLGG